MNPKLGKVRHPKEPKRELKNHKTNQIYPKGFKGSICDDCIHNHDGKCDTHPCVYEPKRKYYEGKKMIVIGMKGSERIMMKDDSEKLRFDLVPFEPIEALAEILTYGAKKYAPNNWKKGNTHEDIERVFAAFMRHINKYRQGEDIDPESGFPHIYHAFCNLAFIIYHYKTGKKRKRIWD